MIPRPARRSSTGAPARLSNGLVIATDEASAGAASLLRAELEAATRWRIEVRDAGEQGPHGTVTLRVEPGAGRSPDSYRLVSHTGGVDITGTGPAGVFYGTRSLLQLLPAACLRSAPSGELPAVVEVAGTDIEDGPRFGWRGAHLDVSRHFMPKTFVLRLIDVLALHKMNVLHLHLTDDQGWRFPVEKWPRLTEVGAWRRESSSGDVAEHRFDGAPHGGFYSKADLHEIVAYAARRLVTVVPEIDMPGHMQAAIAAYPELGNAGEPLEVLTSWGISDHVLNLDEPTIQFCFDVLGEILEVFPSTWIHIGGDECPTAEWEVSARARRRMRELGLEDARSLQGWMTTRLAEFLSERGRTLVGWDEILDAGAPKDAVVMAWRGQHRGASSGPGRTRRGHGARAVALFRLGLRRRPSRAAGDPRRNEYRARLQATSRLPPGSEARNARRVLGAQCQLWTEYVSDPLHAEYMYFPRACAFSEVVWSPADREWAEFLPRLSEHLTRLDALGVNYRPLEGPKPGQAATWPA